MFNFTYTFTYDANSDDCGLISAKASYGKVVVGDPYLAKKMYFKFVGPTGTVIRDYPSDTQPDMTFTGDSSEEFTINGPDIPCDSLNNPLKGEYKIYVKIIDTIDPDTIDEVEMKYTYCPVFDQEDIVIGATVDCEAGTMTITDQSVYGDYVVTDRSLQSNPPTVNNSSLISESTESDTLITYLEYENISYNILLEVTAEKTEVGVNNSSLVFSLTWIDSITRSEETQQDIVCGSSSCGVIDAAYSFVQSAMESACSLGGVNNLPSAQKDKLDSLNYYLTIYNSMARCGSSSLASVLEEIENILGTTAQSGSGAIKLSVGAGGSRIVEQTAWKEVDEADLQANVELGQWSINGTPTDVPFRYRRVATNHLEIHAVLKISASGSITILKDYFKNEFAPKSEFNDQFSASNIVSVWNVNSQGQVQAQSGLGAKIVDVNKDNKWDLIINGVNPTPPYNIVIHGLFAL